MCFNLRGLTRLLFALSLASGVVYCPSALWAQTTYVWNTNASGLWDTPSAWTPTGPASGANNTASFTGHDVSGFNDIGLDTNRTIGHIVVGDTDNGATTPGVWDLFDNDPNVDGRTITLSATGTPSITVNQLGVVNPGVDDFDSFYLLDVSLAGSQGFNKEGPGILTLAGGQNSITGAVNINGGTLRLDSLTFPAETGVFNYAGGAQTITSFNLANGATLHANLDDGINNVVNNVNVAAGANVTIRTGGDNAFLRNVVGPGIGMGSTLNLEWGGTNSDTYTADSNWTGHDNVNVTGLGASPSFFRNRVNDGSGAIDDMPGNSFGSTRLNLDNTALTVRTYSHGADFEIGRLTGTSTATLSGGNAGGGSPVRYQIGGLNESSVFDGTIDGTGGISINKIGTGTLELAGPLTGAPWVIAGADIGRKGGVTRVTTGTLAITGATSIPGGGGIDFSTIDVRAGAFLDVSGAPGTFSTSALQQVWGSGTIIGPYNHDEGRIHPADLPAPDTTGPPNPTDMTNVPVPTAGTINFNGNLILSGGEIVFDMDTTPLGTNDKIMVTGATSVAGGGMITPNFLSGNPAVGLTYTVLESSGGFSDAPAGWTVSWPGRGAKPTVVTNGNLLQFTTTPIGAGASMNWTGANGGIWDIETTQAWYNNDSAGADVFFQNDSVTFADTFAGGTPIVTSTVDLTDAVQPEDVVVDSSTNNYTISGTGSIGGTGSFVKRGTSTLTMQIPNSFSGGATIERGTVDIGAEGGALGSGSLTLGDGTPAGGGTLLMTGTALTKDTITLDGGNSTIRNDNATFFTTPALAGTGNLTFASNDDNLRLDLGAVDPGTSGNITFGVDPNSAAPSNMTVRVNGAGGDFPNAAITLAPGALLANRAGSGTVVDIELGSLTGDSMTTLTPFVGGGSTPGTNWVIGSLNAPTTFAGVINDGGNGFPDPNVPAQGHVTKVGSAQLTLTGANTYTGDTSVEGGTLSITSPFLADGADVYLTSGVTFDLDFGSLAIEDTIDSLFIDGIPQDTGTWGRIGSGADNESNLFDGDGLLMVSTIGGVDGDFDGDLDVDGIDFLIWQRGDSPDGGTPDELAAWEANYGTQPPPLQASAAAVPEPASSLLAVLGLTAACWAAGRRRRSV